VWNQAAPYLCLSASIGGLQFFRNLPGWIRKNNSKDGHYETPIGWEIAGGEEAVVQGRRSFLGHFAMCRVFVMPGIPSSRRD
jgi:hypothetical protein